MMGGNEAVVLFVVVFGMIVIVPVALWIVTWVRGRRSGDER